MRLRSQEHHTQSEVHRWGHYDTEALHVHEGYIKRVQEHIKEQFKCISQETKSGEKMDISERQE